MMQFRKKLTLNGYVDYIQSRGQYTFQKKEAQFAIKSSATSFLLAAHRMIKKKRIISPRRGFFVIVPKEYELAGAPPASWFIDDLMKFHKRPYYVGLLSAAALHGAAHQQPQEFQVITNVPLRSIKVGREKIRFFTKKNISLTSIEKIKSVTGYFNISSPEATAIDLIRYFGFVSHLNHVALILSELKEKLSPSLLADDIKRGGELACAQRLGYILDFLGGKKITKKLHKWVTSQNPTYIPMISVRKLQKKFRRNEKWCVILNEKIELDE